MLRMSNVIIFCFTVCASPGPDELLRRDSDHRRSSEARGSAVLGQDRDAELRLPGALHGTSALPHHAGSHKVGRRRGKALLERPPSFL